MLSGSGAVSSVLPHRQWASQARPAAAAGDVDDAPVAAVHRDLHVGRAYHEPVFQTAGLEQGHGLQQHVMGADHLFRLQIGRFRLASTAAWRMSGKTTTMSQPVRSSGGGPLTSTGKPAD